MSDRDFLFIPQSPKPDPADQHQGAQPQATTTPDVPDSLVVMGSADPHKAVLFGALGFCLFGGWLVWTRGDMLATIIGLIIICFSLAVAFFAYQRFRNPKPVLVISDHGVLDNATFFKAGQIPWDAIDDATIRTVRAQQSIGIQLKPNSPWENNAPLLTKMGIGFNRALGFAPINVPRAAIRKDLRTIQAVIRKKLGKPVTAD